MAFLSSVTTLYKSVQTTLCIKGAEHLGSGGRHKKQLFCFPPIFVLYQFNQAASYFC